MEIFVFYRGQAKQFFSKSDNVFLYFLKVMFQLHGSHGSLIPKVLCIDSFFPELKF